MDHIEYLLALHSVYGLGPIRLKNLLDYFKDSKNIWEANDREIISRGIPEFVVNNLKDARKTINPEKFLEDVPKSGIKWLTIFDDNYPNF